MDSLFSDLEIRLIPYKNNMIQLLPYTGHAKLLSLIHTSFKKTSGKVVGADLVDMAFRSLKSISIPCHTPVDLRCYFDNCVQVDHNNLSHHFDPHAESLFSQFIDTFNGVFPQKAASYVAKNALTRYNEAPSKKSQQKTNKFINTGYRRTQLLRHPKQQHNVRALWFPHDPSSYSKVGLASVGVRVQIQKASLSDIRLVGIENKENGYVYIDSFPDEFHIPHPGKCILHLEKLEHKTSYSIKKCSDALVYSHYINAFDQKSLQSIHDQRDVLEENLARVLLEEKSYSSASSMLVLASTKQNMITIDCGLASLHHGGIQALLSTGNAQLFLNHPQIQSLKDGDFIDGLLYRPTVNTCQFRFVSAELLSGCSKANWNHIQSLCNEGLGLYLRVKACTASIHDAADPSSLPDHCGAEFAYMNQPLHDDIQNIICSSRVFQILDLTAMLPPVFMNTECAPLRKTRMGWLCPVINKDPIDIQWYSSERQEGRTEERFPVKCPLIIRGTVGHPWSFTAVSINISAHGAKVRTKQTPYGEPGAFVSVDWTLLIGGKSISIPNQPYQIIGRNDVDGFTEFRLLLTDKAKSAVKAIRFASLTWSQELAGISDPSLGHFSKKRILRNIQAANTWTPQYFLGKSKFGLYADSYIDHAGAGVQFDESDLIAKISEFGIPKDCHQKIWHVYRDDASEGKSLFIDPSQIFTNEQKTRTLHNLVGKGFHVRCLVVSRLVTGDSLNSRYEMDFLEKLAPLAKEQVMTRIHMLTLRVDVVDITSILKIHQRLLA